MALPATSEDFRHASGMATSAWVKFKSDLTWQAASYVCISSGDFEHDLSTTLHIRPAIAIVLLQAAASFHPPRHVELLVESLYLSIYPFSAGDQALSHAEHGSPLSVHQRRRLQPHFSHQN